MADETKVAAPPADLTKPEGRDPKPSTSKKSAGVKKSVSKRSASLPEHPKYSVMIADAISSLKERGGSSRQAILKYISNKYSLGTEAAKINSRLKIALKAGVKAGTLKQSKGTGAAGSFRLGEGRRGTRAERKRPPSMARKAKKPTKVAARKPGKKGTPKKAPPKKPKTAKSPAKKTANKKSAAGFKVKSPGKKAPPKKPKAASKPKPKKSPAKKVPSKTKPKPKAKK